jgi:conjugative relaxase-like TrwC/TraI family protein
VLTIRAMADGKGYSARHLEHSDYYAEGEKVVGRWQGRGAELLGLAGEVRADEFESLRQGIDPHTDVFLRQRQSADRLNEAGEVESHGRHLYDFTISAPKSISVMAIVGGDERLISAHETAVAEALKELEEHAAARVRLNGANADRATGNLAIAVYHHDTSRELDPQLHTHAVATNLTYDGIEGRWKALQASGIYERRAYLTEVYRNSLAREVRALGYEIDDRRDSKGRDCGFEIRGVSDPLLSKFSQRSRQRDEAIDKFIQENGRRPSDNEVAVLVRESRANKLTEVSTEELRAHQLGRLTPEESQELGAVSRGAASQAIAADAAEVSLDYAQDHVFERLSVARDHEILAEALRHGRGRISHSELKGTLALREASGAILRDGEEIATRASLQSESEMIDLVNRGVGSCTRLGGSERFLASDRLNPEQKRTVEFVLDSRDRAISISGAAGTGKTATLQELRRGLREARRGVLAVAPTMSAVEELQKVGFENAVTVARVLQDQTVQNELQGKVVILDEAGMVSARQMNQFLRLAEQRNARVVFAGDTKQIQSVEAGDSLRILEKESRLKSVGLTEVKRQIVKDYRDAIQELRRDPERGFEKLEAIGAVREVAFADRADEVAKAFAAARTQHGEQRSVLVVCPTHDEIERVTNAIRSDLRRSGKLGAGLQTTRDVALNWTAAEKSDPRNFRAGQILTFHRAVRGIAKNERVEVTRVEGTHVIVRNAGGTERSLTAKQAKSFEVYDRRPIDIAVGDRLLLTANRREREFRATNGEIVTVAGVDERGSVRLEDGRTLPRDYKQFAHGYAVTAHRSQGKSVDSVIISGDGMRKELFYVAASRGRQSVRVVTSDKEALREMVGRSTARKSASELARKIGLGIERGEHRGITVAAAMARRFHHNVREPRVTRMRLEHRAQEVIREPHIEQQRNTERSYEQGIGR